MIDFLRGSVVEVHDDSIVVDVGGVGYRVYCPAPHRFRQSKDEPVTVYTHLHVREDEWVLYGFAQPQERILFRQLLAVAGVGPKLAIAILGAADYGKVAAAIAGEDVATLTRLPGVGKKTAQRLIVELKDKVTVPITAGGTPTSLAVAPSDQSLPGGVWHEVAAALRTLGYTEAEVRPVLRELARQTGAKEVVPELALRLALQRIDTYRRVR